MVSISVVLLVSCLISRSGIQACILAFIPEYGWVNLGTHVSQLNLFTENHAIKLLSNINDIDLLLNTESFPFQKFFL